MRIAWVLVAVLLALVTWVVTPPIVARISYSVATGRNRALREQLSQMAPQDVWPKRSFGSPRRSNRRWSKCA